MITEDLPVGDGVAQWEDWGTVVRIVVTEAGALAEAESLVRAEMAEVASACSRFRPSELDKVHNAEGQAVEVSERLADLVSAALQAARFSNGDVDPTMGKALAALGYDRDFAIARKTVRVRATPSVGVWRAIELDERRLTVPAGVRLDLGATAKAHTADRCAQLISTDLGTGVLVSLGGDIATAGPGPEGGWGVLVRDSLGDPACTISLRPGFALATSSTTSRQWRDAGRTLHHVLDPRTCLPALPVWRTATVVAPSCLQANTITTAALVRGERAPAWIRLCAVPARLVAADAVHLYGGWPSEEDSND